MNPHDNSTIDVVISITITIPVLEKWASASMDNSSISSLHQKISVLKKRAGNRGVAMGGISVYIPPNQSTLNFFMWLFCLLDPFMPTQIKFLASPLAQEKCSRKRKLKPDTIAMLTSLRWPRKLKLVRSGRSVAEFGVLRHPVIVTPTTPRAFPLANQPSS